MHYTLRCLAEEDLASSVDSFLANTHGSGEFLANAHGLFKSQGSAVQLAHLSSVAPPSAHRYYYNYQYKYYYYYYYYYYY